MIKISKQDWEKFVRDNNPEIFTEDQINFWIESNKEILLKAETDDIQDKDKKLVEGFRTELSHFTKVEVMGENPDKLQKSLKHDIYFIREKQVDWDETIEKSEDGEDYSFGTFRNTPLNNKLGRVGNLIEKGKRGQLGEVREWKSGKYKKTAQGWVPVSEGKENSTNKVKDDNNGIVSDKELKNKVKSEYYIQYKNKWGEIYQKPFVATSIEEAIEMAKEQKIGSDIGPSKIPDKTGREEKDQYIKEIESKKEGDKNSQPKGEEKAKLLKEVFESMDFLDIDRKEFSELKEKHGGLKGLHEFLSNELSGEHNKIDIKIGDELVDDDGNEVTVTSLNKESVWIKDEKGNEKRYPWKIVSQKFEKITDNSTMSRSDEGTTKK